MCRMVLTQILRWLKWSLGCALFVSCDSYRILQIDIPRPATVTLETSGRIAVLGRNTTNSSGYPSHWFPQEETILHFVDGMNSGLAYCGRTDSVVPLRGSEPIVLKYNELPDILDAFEIADLCNKYSVDYIIELVSRQNPADWRKNQISDEWHIRLYSAISVKLLDSVTFFDRYSGNVLEDEFAENIWNNGFQYVERILPHWQATTRRIYNGGRILKLGDYFFKQGDTIQAVKVWQSANNSSLDKAMKAAMNTAWVRESEGYPEQALEIMDECRKRADWNTDSSVGKYFLKYYAILEERIKESEILIRQSQM